LKARSANVGSCLKSIQSAIIYTGGTSSRRAPSRASNAHRRQRTADLGLRLRDEAAPIWHQTSNSKFERAQAKDNNQ
jgi:hypothetical protein